MLSSPHHLWVVDEELISDPGRSAKPAQSTFVREVDLVDAELKSTKLCLSHLLGFGHLV